jgi:hypothetical protein
MRSSGEYSNSLTLKANRNSVLPQIVKEGYKPTSSIGNPSKAMPKHEMQKN